MAVRVIVEVERELEIESDYDTVFEYLADVPRSARHFPNVDRLTDLGQHAYKWEMKKFGVDKYAIQSIYAVKYSQNKSKGWIKWVPVPGIGNGVVEGKWAIRDRQGKIHLTFYSKGEITLPLPALTRIIVAPLVVREFTGLVDKFLKSLKKELSA